MSRSATIDCEFVAYGTRVKFHLPSPQDHIQRQLLQRRSFYEQAMLEDIGPRLPENALVVDVGANIGNHTLFFSGVLGVKTLAFEPNPTALSVLRANIEINGLTEKVEVHPVALGANNGSGRMIDDDPGNLGKAHVDTRGMGSVKIRRLDDIVGNRHVSLMKIDVEGMEPEVLRGASDTLARCKPWLLVEAATLDALKRVEAVVRPLGYRKLKVYNDTPTYLFGMVHGQHTASDDSPTSVIRSLDPRHLASLPPTREIVAGMATVAGNETALRATVMSLIPQVDRLYLYLNGFRSAPRFIQNHPKIRYVVDEDGRRYGDAGKFWGMEEATDAIYLTCDDDIIYPVDFVSRMVGELAQLGGKGAVGVHGSLILQPSRGYYQDGSRAVFHFERPLMRARRVHVVATNACAFHTQTVQMTLADFKHPNMADIWLAQYLHQNRLPAFVVPRRSNWLIPLEVKRPTIYAQSRAGTGSAYDSSRRQDEVLATMYPVSLLQAESPLMPLAVHVLEADGPAGVSEFISAVCAREREPVVFVVCDQATEAMREAALRPQAMCEVHLLDRESGISPIYTHLISSSPSPVRTWRLRGEADLQPMPSGAWRRCLNGAVRAREEDRTLA